MNLLDMAVARFQSNMNRSSIQTCSQWAEAYRVMGKPIPGPWKFKTHPWLKEMHDSPAEENVGMKAAQMGFTECVLNICFHAIDILQQDVLYVLPNLKPDAANFSASRFDAALSLSTHLSTLFSDVKNVGHKRAGSANMFIRGSQSESGLKNISTPVIILDELEEMNQKNIELAFERASGQFEGTIKKWLISTPGVFNDGVHKYFIDSTQDHFWFRCPGCNRYIELTYPDSLVVTGEDQNDKNLFNSHYQCKECKVKLHQELKSEYFASGIWQSSFKDRIRRGWHIPQLYSCTITPGNFAIIHFKALKDPAARQQLWNSKMGLPYEEEGARVTDKELADCIGEFSMVKTYKKGYVTMGVDVGKLLHVNITDWTLPQQIGLDINTEAHSRLLWSGEIEQYETLDLLMHNFGVRMCVVDAQPETRKADEFCKRNPGRAVMCYYGNSKTGNVINYHEKNETIVVDRTYWLDTSLSRFRRNGTKLPGDINKNWKEHLKNQVRKYKKDKNDHDVAYYHQTGPDHHGHSWNYNEIALPMSLGVGVVKDVEEAVI